MTEAEEGAGGMGKEEGKKEEREEEGKDSWREQVEKVEEEIPVEEAVEVEVERAHLVVEKAHPVGDWEGLGDSGQEDR